MLLAQHIMSDPAIIVSDIIGSLRLLTMKRCFRENAWLRNAILMCSLCEKAAALLLLSRLSFSESGGKEIPSFPTVHGR